MKILFICSGLNSGKPGDVVANQAASLLNKGIDLEFFIISKRGWIGYLSNYSRLRKIVKSNKIDLYHAHYGLSGILALLTRCKPLLVSLMGSDLLAPGFLSMLVRVICKIGKFTVIVKTEELYQKVKRRGIHIIPNGVNMEVFKPSDKIRSREILEYPVGKKYILFLSNPERREKNYNLALKAVNLLNDADIQLLTVNNVSNVSVSHYLNMADVLLITSLWEGSPNIVKEAMACCVPIVSTDVGDIKNLFSGVNGCYIVTHRELDVAEKINEALMFGARTNGREKILQLGLDADSTAKNILDLYQSIISQSGSVNNKISLQ